MLGAQSCWKTDISSAMKDKFVGYQQIIQDFHGSVNYGNDFEPIKYKTQVVDGIIYTIQYKTADGVVQATVYEGHVNRTVKKDTESKVELVYLKPQVTQFVDEKGNVKGAYKIGASLMMMASLIATVMLA